MTIVNFFVQFKALWCPLEGANYFSTTKRTAFYFTADLNHCIFVKNQMLRYKTIRQWPNGFYFLYMYSKVISGRMTMEDTIGSASEAT